MKLLFNFRSSITLILVLLLKIAEDTAMSIEFYWNLDDFLPNKVYIADILIYIIIIICIIYVCMEMFKWWFMRDANKEISFEEMNKKYSFKD